MCHRSKTIKRLISESNRKGDNGKNLLHLESINYKSMKSFSIGLFSGLAGALVGMGGGFIMIPLMTSPYLLRLPQQVAHGTSLFAVASTGVAGALGYGIHEVVDVDSAAAIAVCGMITAHLGAAATVKMSASRLKTSLGIFMISMAPMVLAKDQIANFKIKNNTDNQSNDVDNDALTLVKKVLPAGGIGIFSGFLAGIFGVGGGAIVVPALTLATNMTHHSALGTSLCAMVLPAMVGTLTHIKNRNIAMSIAPTLAFGSFVGAYIGGKIGFYLPEKYLRCGFSGVMFVLGLRNIIRV